MPTGEFCTCTPYIPALHPDMVGAPLRCAFHYGPVEVAPAVRFIDPGTFPRTVPAKESQAVLAVVERMEASAVRGEVTGLAQWAAELRIALSGGAC